MGAIRTIRRLVDERAAEQAAADERERHLQETRDAVARRRQMFIDREQRAADAIAERDRQYSDAKEAERQRLQEATDRAESAWLTRRRELEQHLANAKAAVVQLSGGEPDLSSVEAAVEAAGRAASLVGARELVERAQSRLAHHEGGRPRRY